MIHLSQFLVNPLGVLQLQGIRHLRKRQSPRQLREAPRLKRQLTGLSRPTRVAEKVFARSDNLPLPLPLYDLRRAKTQVVHCLKALPADSQAKAQVLINQTEET